MICTHRLCQDAPGHNALVAQSSPTWEMADMEHPCCRVFLWHSDATWPSELSGSALCLEQGCLGPYASPSLPAPIWCPLSDVCTSPV